MRKTSGNHFNFKDAIIYEDDSFIIINKPPHIATLADRNSPINILKLAKEYWGDAKVCHRLDKETSGLLVVAKNQPTYVYFSSLFEKREVVKIYHTIADGRHEVSELEINKPLFSSSNRTRVDFREGKPSVTLVTTLNIYKKHTLLACMPFTGRMHQIRVHLASEGMPVSGDETYGGTPILLSQLKRNYHPSKDKEENPLNSRLLLHAAGIAFPDKNGNQVKFEAPYPKDFEVVLKQLEKNKV